MDIIQVPKSSRNVYPFTYSLSILVYTTNFLVKSQNEQTKLHSHTVEWYKISLCPKPGQININEFPHTILLAERFIRREENNVFRDTIHWFKSGSWNFSFLFLAILVLVSENFRIIPSPTLFLENWYSSPNVKYSSKQTGEVIAFTTFHFKDLKTLANKKHPKFIGPVLVVTL